MKITKIRINDDDYGDDQVRIEALSWWNSTAGKLDWAVPAWEEMGLPELAGIFPDRASAQAAIDSVAEHLPMYGYKVAE